MNLIGCISVPDNKFSVLASGHKVPGISRPVHGVNLDKTLCKTPPQNKETSPGLSKAESMFKKYLEKENKKKG